MRSQAGKIIAGFLSVALLSSATGCKVVRGVEYDEHRCGKNWTQDAHVRKHRLPNGRMCTETTAFSKSFKCVDKKGKRIDASTPQECLRLKGKVIEETTVVEDVHRD